MEIDPKLTALCRELLRDDVGSERFNRLLLQCGITVDSSEWNVAAKTPGPGDDIQHSLGVNRIIRH